MKVTLSDTMEPPNQDIQKEILQRFEQSNNDETDWQPNTQQQFELCAAAGVRYAQQHELIAEPILVIFLLSIIHSSRLWVKLWSARFLNN